MKKISKPMAQRRIINNSVETATEDHFTMAAIVATAKAAAIVNTAPSKRLPSGFSTLATLMLSLDFKSPGTRPGKLRAWL